MTSRSLFVFLSLATCRPHASASQSADGSGPSAALASITAQDGAPMPPGDGASLMSRAAGHRVGPPVASFEGAPLASRAAPDAPSRPVWARDGATHAHGSALDAAMEACRQRARVPALAYAAVHADERVALGATGYADVATGAPATAETPFEAASIAKTIIAAGALELVEQRRVDLDADVSGYLGFSVKPPGATRPLTLRTLLTHTARIADRAEEVEATATVPLRDFLARYFSLAQAKARGSPFLPGEPGAAYAYSNVGASLAAHVVERVSGARFDRFAERQIFARLRMHHTSFSARPDAATPYAQRDGFVPLAQPSHALWPVVDLRSSAADLARYAQALLRDGELDGARILTAESVRTLFATGNPVGAKDQALAWQRRTVAGVTVMMHEGEDAGASTALVLDRPRRVAAVVLANGDAFTGGGPARARALEEAIIVLLERAVLPSAGAQ